MAQGAKAQLRIHFTAPYQVERTVVKVLLKKKELETPRNTVPAIFKKEDHEPTGKSP